MKTHSTYTPSFAEPEVEHQGEQRKKGATLLRSINPSNRTAIGEVELTSAAAAGELVEQAREAQRAWMRSPLSRRIEAAEEVLQQLLTWRGELLELLCEETGKSTAEAHWELWNTCEEVADICRQAQEKLSTQSRSALPLGAANLTSWHPRGVVLVVASGYEPLQSVVAPALAALVAGNAVIVVSDAQTPLTVRSLANIASTAGLHESLWQAVAGEQQLLEDLAKSSDAIISYGEASLTRRLARGLSGRMVPVMGRWSTGDVMIVLNDADVKEAARAAVQSACCGSGRRRRALRRIYVQDTVVDRFVDAVVEEVGALRHSPASPGDPLHVGPFFEERDLQRLERLVDEAAADGARLIAGGRRRPRCRGAYFEPTVLTGMSEEMRLWSEDVHGPVVAIARVRAPAEAVMRTRSIEGYGAVAIFSGSRSVARDLSARLDAPVVGINQVVCDLPLSAPPAPVCAQGPLDPLGAERLQALSRQVVVVEKRWPAVSRLLPRRSKKVDLLLTRAIAAVHRRGLMRRTMETIWPPH